VAQLWILGVEKLDWYEWNWGQEFCKNPPRKGFGGDMSCKNSVCETIFRQIYSARMSCKNSILEFQLGRQK
jgi:hypothetical protein